MRVVYTAITTGPMTGANEVGTVCTSIDVYTAFTVGPSSVVYVDNTRKEKRGVYTATVIGTIRGV
jgi:hypothetical protein